MFKKPTPEEAVKMAKQMFDALTPKQQAIAIDLHIAAHGRMRNEVPAPVFSKAAQNLPGTADADHLLDTIGALHTRNKGLQKGHATLTRRVQELEKELASAQQAFIGQAFGESIPYPTGTLHMSDRAVDAIIADVMKPEQPITAADVRLQADIKALTDRVAAIEFAASPGVYDPFTTDKDLIQASDSFNAAVKQQLLKHLQPGGVLYRGAK